MNAIIEGEVVRFALAGKTVEFNVRVSKTLLEKNEFTLGTVVSCVVYPEKIGIGDCIIKEGHLIPVKNFPEEKEPYKTALALAVGDKVSVELEKSEGGTWTVAGIKHNPVKGQDVDDFLYSLEEILEERKRKKH